MVGLPVQKDIEAGREIGWEEGHHPGRDQWAGPVALFPREPAEGRERGEEHLMIAEKRLGLRDQGGEVVQMQGLLAQELTEGLAFSRAKGLEPQMETDLLLVCRDGGLALGIGVDVQSVLKVTISTFCKINKL